MPFAASHLTPARVAAAAALATVAAGLAPALIGLYVCTVAVAVMLGAAFAAYLAVVDEPGEWVAFELGACAVAAALTLAGTSLRLPVVVAGSAPGIAVKLGWLALAVAGSAAVASLVRERPDAVSVLRDAWADRVARRTEITRH
jgi:hypothetical protein